MVHFNVNYITDMHIYESTTTFLHNYRVATGLIDQNIRTISGKSGPLLNITKNIKIIRNIRNIRTSGHPELTYTNQTHTKVNVRSNICSTNHRFPFFPYRVTNRNAFTRNTLRRAADLLKTLCNINQILKILSPQWWINPLTTTTTHYSLS